MKKIVLALIAMVLFSSHDMYLKLDNYFLQPDTSATIKLFNGTFDKSENTIDRDRMTDVSLVGNGNRSKVDNSQWSERDSITILDFKTGKAGTWVAGVSTAPRTIEMDAADFNDYLEHDGVLDMLDSRRENDKLESDAVEEYSKHVKVIFQVGDTRTDDWQTALGYPIEFIPLSNPYDLNTGDELEVKLLRNGEPLADQLIYADYKGAADGHSHENDHEEATEHSHDQEADEASTPEHTHESENGHTHDGEHTSDAEHGHSHAQDHTHETENDHTHDDGHDSDSEHGHSHADDPKATEENHQHTSGYQLRTDSSGIVKVDLSADGIWYLRTINLVNSEKSGLTHESNWATLTFEVTHRHGEDTHVHADEDEGGLPSYVYWVGSFILLGGLFFWFNRKN